MPKIDVTTVALRLPRKPDTDVWDNLLRIASSDADPVDDNSEAFLRLLGTFHVVALVLVAAHAWLVAAWWRPLWQPFLVTVMAAMAPCLLLLVLGTRQRNQVAYIPRVSFATAPEYLNVIFGSLAVAALILGLAMLSLPLRFPSAVFMAWAVVPVASLVAVSLALPMFLPRYLLFTTPGWALLAE